MPVVTVRPDSTVQLGSWTIVGGAGTAHQSLLDASDATYVQLVTRCRNDPQVLKLGVGDVALPDGAKIFSVRTRIRVETVTGFFTPQPRCLGWFFCRKPRNLITAIIFLIFRLLFGWRCPKKPIVEWVEQELGYFTTDPEGVEWTQESFNDFELHLGRDDDAGNTLRISAAYIDVDYNERPVTTVTAPTGTITDTTRPLVTWTFTDPESDRQQAWNARVFPQATYEAVGFDPAVSTAVAESGWVKGDELTWSIDRDLVNSLYRVYVTTEQAWGGVGLHRSLPAFIGWTQAVPGPPAPVLAATVDNTLNRVSLAISKGGESPATETYTVETSDNAGVTFEPLRDAIQVVADGGGNATVYDYSAPLNVLRQYRALAYRTLGSIKVSSGYSNVASAVPESLDHWFKDPLDPTRNTVLPVANDDPSRSRSQGQFAPLVAEGRDAEYIVVTGPLYGLRGTLEFIFTERDPVDYWARFLALYEPGTTVLWQRPDGSQCFIRFGPEVSWPYLPSGTQIRYRRPSVTYTQVAPPPIL